MKVIPTQELTLLNSLYFYLRVNFAALKSVWFSQLFPISSISCKLFITALQYFTYTKLLCCTSVLPWTLRYNKDAYKISFRNLRVLLPIYLLVKVERLEKLSFWQESRHAEKLGSKRCLMCETTSMCVHYGHRSSERSRAHLSHPVLTIEWLVFYRVSQEYSLGREPTK